MKEWFIYLTWTIEIAMFAALIIIVCSIAADIKVIKNTVSQQTHERNYDWFRPSHRGNASDTLFIE